jgi:hypothetical protein
VYRTLTCSNSISISRSITEESNKFSFTIFGDLKHFLCNFQIHSLNNQKNTRWKPLGPPRSGTPGRRQVGPGGQTGPGGVKAGPVAWTRDGGAPERAHDAARARTHARAARRRGGRRRQHGEGANGVGKRVHEEWGAMGRLTHGKDGRRKAVGSGAVESVGV